MNKILGFDKNGPYEFLSNFALSRVWLDDDPYPSVEHAYQAAKSTNRRYRMTVAEAGTPGEAKKLGRMATLRDGWNEMRIEVMEKLLLEKFSVEWFLLKLLATNGAYLEETNWWNDTYWGVCKGVGENNLGKLLMKIREEYSKRILNGDISWINK